MNLLDEDEATNPVLSVVNLVDVFLVIIGALLIAIAQNPLHPLAGAENAVVIKNPGQEDMEMIIKQGKKIERYKSSGEIGGGQGVRAGIAYRLKDGSFVYVPEREAESLSGKQ